jgi:hypothetical protein
MKAAFDVDVGVDDLFLGLAFPTVETRVLVNLLGCMKRERGEAEVKVHQGTAKIKYQLDSK